MTHLLQNLLGLKVKDPKQQENKIMRRRSVFVSVATLWLDAIFFVSNSNVALGQNMKCWIDVALVFLKCIKATTLKWWTGEMTLRILSPPFETAAISCTLSCYCCRTHASWRCCCCVLSEWCLLLLNLDISVCVLQYFC